MKPATFSFVAKFPAKKVRECFDPKSGFAKVHTATKIFAKTGMIKSEKSMIIKTVAIPGSEKAAFPVVAVITFAEADGGKATAVDASLINVPEGKAADIKAYGKVINADIAKFLTPAPKAVKAPAKKAATKKTAAEKKAAGAKKAAKPAAEKKIAAKKPAAAKKAAAKKPAATKKTATKPAPEVSAPKA